MNLLLDSGFLLFQLAIADISSKTSTVVGVLATILVAIVAIRVGAVIDVDIVIFRRLGLGGGCLWLANGYGAGVRGNLNRVTLSESIAPIGDKPRRRFFGSSAEKSIGYIRD